MWSSDDYGERKAKALKTSNFAQTCNLLSRYMKKKGSLKDLNLEIGGKVESLETLVKPGSLLASSSDTSRNGWKSGHPTAENPVIMVEDDSNKTSTSRQGTMKDDKKKAQLTIFYGGKVLVFDDFPANKVREVVHLAKRSSSQMSYGFTSSVVVQEQEKEKEKEKERPNHVHAASTSSPRDGLPPRPKAQAAGKQHVSVKDKVSISSVTEAGPSTSKPQEDLSPTSSDGNGSDLPIARRSSLHRFLEKRKDRAALRGPYQNQNNQAPLPKGDESIDLNNFPESD